MSGARLLLGGLVVLTALLLQVAVLARLPLPGAAPELLVLVVVAFALAEGPASGMLTGFAGGLAADLLADHALGRWALSLTVVGYLAGLAARDGADSLLRAVAVVGGASVGAVLLFAGTGVLLGDPRVTGEATARALAGPVAYAVLLTPLVVPPVHALLRRVDGDPLALRRRT